MRTRNDELEKEGGLEESIEMPEGPEDTPGDALMIVRGGRGKAPQRVSIEPGEDLLDAFRQVQRERSGAGAVYVLRLDALEER